VNAFPHSSPAPDGDASATPDARSSAPPGDAPAEAPSLPGLQCRLAEFARVRDWGRYHTPKNLAAALSVEAGELVEIFQWLTPEESARVMADRESAARVEDEVADVLAYLLQFCGVLGVDALAALEAKIARNEKRFPAPENGDSME
jgi:NTP pyrophosphatase (non-canonical NTP hydrolase)